MKNKIIPLFTWIPLFFISNLYASAPMPQETFVCDALESELSDISSDLVIKSHFIIKGKIDVPKSEIKLNKESNSHSYIELALKTGKIFKGKVKETENISIRYYTDEKWYKPCTNTLIKLDNKEVIVFLVKSNGALYFARSSPNSLLGVKKGMDEKIIEEIERQNEILSAPDRARSAEEELIYQKVKSLIETSLILEKQQSSYKDLEELGMKAVPAIISLMNDYRPLPSNRISFINKSKNSFEAIRHYGPEVVVDALAAILNQITGKSYGSIYNGATDNERRHTINGWKIYSSTLH